MPTYGANQRAVVTQSAAQMRNLALQATVCDDFAGPDPLRQLVLGHHAAACIEQGEQDVERATAQGNRHAIGQHFPPMGQDREAAKLDFRLGNKPQAEQFLKEALKISVEKNLPAENIKVLSDLDHLKMNLGQMSESRELLDKAADLAEKSPDPAAQATYIYVEGEYYFYIYDLENAVGFYQKSLALWDKTGKPAEKAKIFISPGYCYASQSDFGLSLKTLHEALDIYRENNNLRGETLTHIAIGATFTLMGEKQKSLESYRKAEKMFPEDLDLIERATLFNGLAYYFENYGEYQISLDYRKKAYL